MIGASEVEELRGLVARARGEGRISEAAAAGVERWLTGEPFAPYLETLAGEIRAGRWRELDDAFYQVLEFGTGGRRGRMYPVGTNVLNARTIAESARGLADHVIAAKGPGAELSCVVARDTRRNSPEFAEICARVLAAAGFRVHLFDEPRSTPLLSTAVRVLKCDAGIMITASHNPPPDNGFKCYSATGGQVIPPDDAGIIARVREASARAIPIAEPDDPRILRPGREVDEAYLAAVLGESVSDARDASVVYTPMHGVGDGACGEAMRRAGFRVEVLESQRTPDGDFPNVPGHVSNPEIPETLGAAIARARETGADVVIASDPDADRIGVGVPRTGDPRGEWTTLTGNQIGALLAAFVVEKTAEAGRLRPDHYLVTTLVSTGMTRALAEAAGIGIEDDLPVGFKWIAARVDRRGPENFLFGFEESHGYLKGTHARDKDAGVAAMLFAELVADLKRRGTHVLAHLDRLYERLGHHGERTINKTLEGREGAGLIKKLMEAFRASPPRAIGGLDVIEARDYKTGESRALSGPNAGTVSKLDGPTADMMIFQLGEPGTRFAARPSGTEPKIKFYCFARSPVEGSGPDAVAQARARTEARLDRMAADLDAYVREALAGGGAGG